MNLDFAIESYESELAYYEKLSDSNDPFNLSQCYWKNRIAEYKQLIEWLKDYKRLLEGERGRRKWDTV